jgi:putative tryptophan/tyrosine transport system substrate-binding protein
MRRRDFGLSLLTLSCLPLGRLGAQIRLPKVAILAPDTPDYEGRPTASVNILLAALGEFGYVAGHNVEYDFRFAHHALERLPALAADLVAQEPDVLYTWTSGGARAAAAATSTVPIVIAPVSAETLATLVPDFARPPGNITGFTFTSLEQRQKGLQLLKEVAPHIRRVGLLLNPLNPAWDLYPEVLEEAAQALDLELVRIEARGPAEIDQAFAAMAAQGVDALYGLGDSTLIGAEPTPERIFELLAEYGLPSASDESEFALEGGLVSLGIDEWEPPRGAAQYIHRILQGAKVRELPVVLPSRFILAVNLRTAEQLGIEIPQSVLLRADEVFE